MSTSPPRNRGRSTTKSPPRQPLSQRSQSDNNEQRHSTTPSIRIVADNGPSAYTKSPFPTLPAHRLPPGSNYAPKTFSYYQDAHVSDENTPTNADSSPEKDDASLLSLPDLPYTSPSYRASSETTVSSDADTLANYNSSLSPTLSSRFSQTNTAPSTPTLQEDDAQAVKLPQVPDNLASHSQSTIRLVIPSGSNNVPPLSNRQSASPTASSASPLLETVENERHGSSSPSSKSSNPTQLPRLPSDHTITGPANHFEPQSPSTKSKRAPTLGGSSSTDSIPYSDASYSVVQIIHPRSNSSPPSTSHAGHSGTDDNSVIKYPVVKQQTASGEWATVSKQDETQSRMNDDYRNSSVWSARLSTIPSESEPGSQSLSSGPVSPVPTARLPRLRRVIGSIVSSEGDNDRFDPSHSFIAIPAPLFSHPTGRRLPSPPGHDTDEDKDTLGELTSPRLQPKRSGYLTRIRGLSRPGSSESMKSQLSFTGESLSWVKRFYSSGEWPRLESPLTSPTQSTSRLDTATSGTTSSPVSDAFPAEIFRPRNRPRDDRGRRNVRHQPSLETVESQAVSDGTWSDRFRRPLWASSAWGSGIFSPHLHRDRRNNHGINAWSSPSIEDPTRSPFGPVERQIWLFCLGFVFPFAWFFAAFLPIPAKPLSLDPNAPLEQGIPRGRNRNFLRSHPGALVSIERLEKQYVKSHWWRSLNRIMCVAGLLIIGAIVALIILALRMRGSL